MNKSMLYKGCLEPIVLQLLQEKDSLYGYQIIQLVKDRTNSHLIITEGALYPILHKLEEEGILSTRFEKFDNRTRKYYCLTKTGKKQTVSVLQEMQSFLQNMQFLLQPKTI